MVIGIRPFYTEVFLDINLYVKKQATILKSAPRKKEIEGKVGNIKNKYISCAQGGICTISNSFQILSNLGDKDIVQFILLRSISQFLMLL